MKIKKDTVVSFEYTLRGDDGEVIDTSVGGDPMAYLHGSGGIIPGLEKKLEGRTTGDHFSVEIPPEDGYGKRFESLVVEIPVEKFDGIDKLEEGLQIEMTGEHGNQIGTITNVADKIVTVDSNHPLADRTLHFDITIKGIREATTEELDHGHVHGPGCHHHH